MSDAVEPSDGGPTDGPPRDLFAGAPGWESPLSDLTEAATGADAPGQDVAQDDDDLWAPGPSITPAAAVDADPAGPLSDLTRRPRRGRRSSGGRPERPDDGRARPAGGATGPGAGSSGASRRARRTAGPVAAALAAARDGSSASGTTDTAPGPEGREDAPRGLATGGPIGGLEPGTLFGPPDEGPEGAAGTRGGKRRRGRRRRGDDTPTDGATTEPERPLTAEERLQHALKLSYRHLTKRDRTVSEVRAHLEKREVDEASIVGALAELVEFRYLDDERYAARFVEDKRRLEGWGHLRIEQGLRRTGVAREVADAAVAADPLRDDEADLAVEALEQRLGGRAPDDDRSRQKALRLLATKGYPLDTAYAAVRAYERRCAERDDG